MRTLSSVLIIDFSLPYDLGRLKAYSITQTVSIMMYFSGDFLIHTSVDLEMYDLQRFQINQNANLRAPVD